MDFQQNMQNKVDFSRELVPFDIFYHQYDYTDEKCSCA